MPSPIRTTIKGRVVYNRPIHKWNYKDARRVLKAVFDDENRTETVLSLGADLVFFAFDLWLRVLGRVVASLPVGPASAVASLVVRIIRRAAADLGVSVLDFIDGLFKTK